MFQCCKWKESGIGDLFLESGKGNTSNLDEAAVCVLRTRTMVAKLRTTVCTTRIMRPGLMPLWKPRACRSALTALTSLLSRHSRYCPPLPSSGQSMEALDDTG